MSTKSLKILRLGMRKASRAARRLRIHVGGTHPHPELPDDVWFEIFTCVWDRELLVLSRVCRAFNDMAMRQYLSRRGISAESLDAGVLTMPVSTAPTFSDLCTALYLPPIRKLTCTVWGPYRKFWDFPLLRRFIRAHRTLEEFHIRFFDVSAANGRSPTAIDRHAAQREWCLLLNWICPPGKSLVISDMHAVVFNLEDGARWRVVRQAQAPVRGRMRKIATIAKRNGLPTMDLMLQAVCKIRGETRKELLHVDSLLAVDIMRTPTPAGWSIVSLDAHVLQHLNLAQAMLTSEDWVHTLPLITLPALLYFTMGVSRVYTGFEAESGLGVVSREVLDTFLLRHTTITNLEYMPSILPPINPSQSPHLSLTSFPDLTHLTTTPAHFIYLNGAPTTKFERLSEVTLFATTSVTLAQVQAEFATVLRLLSENTTGSNIALRIPGKWITPPSEVCTLSISCISSIRLLGDFELTPHIIAWLSLFEHGILLRLELFPRKAVAFARKQFVDKVRKEAPWLEEVSCPMDDFFAVRRVGPLSVDAAPFTFDGD
ncbi:hypothetical protein C8J57DRAFT_1385487 [Mycena rebaudengoi]|nr:hypothetical protein C8J57DRAFT_1385487 [Mycena rebaudengoi]